MKSMIQFCKKEAVLSIAVVLALLSVFFVRPDAGYLAYIDFRTLGILFLPDDDCGRLAADRGF